MVQAETLTRFAALVERRLGLSGRAAREALLAEVLLERVAGGDVEGYLRRLESCGPRDAEVRALAERLMPGETYFLRGPGPLRALVDEVLPSLQRQGRVARVLCAGCSSGEEAYSLCLLALEHGALDASLLQVIAIDVNPRALGRARRARYPAASLCAVDEPLRQRWFRALPGGSYELRPEVRAPVCFEERNLLDDAPSFWVPGSFDVILCRNVTEAFAPAVRAQVLARLARALAPGGCLLLGPAESLEGLPQGLEEDFERVLAGEDCYYRRLEEALPEPQGPGPQGEPPDLEAVLRLCVQQRYAEAWQLLEALPERGWPPPEVRLARAALLFWRGQRAQAEQLGQALAISASQPAAAHYLLGLCREQAGDESGAWGHFERAVQLDPTLALGHLRLGMLARRGGSAARARASLRLALLLLERAWPLHLALLGGGLGRHGLMQACQQELQACAEVA